MAANSAHIGRAQLTSHSETAAANQNSYGYVQLASVQDVHSALTITLSARIRSSQRSKVAKRRNFRMRTWQRTATDWHTFSLLHAA